MKSSSATRISSSMGKLKNVILIAHKYLYYDCHRYEYLINLRYPTLLIFINGVMKEEYLDANEVTPLWTYVERLSSHNYKVPVQTPRPTNDFTKSKNYDSSLDNHDADKVAGNDYENMTDLSVIFSVAGVMTFIGMTVWAVYRFLNLRQTYDLVGGKVVYDEDENIVNPVEMESEKFKGS